MQTLRRTPLYDRACRRRRPHRPVRGLGDAGAVRGRDRRAQGGADRRRRLRRLAHGRDRGRGPDGGELLQRLLSNDVSRLEVGEAQYTLLTNEAGGIVDDLIVYRTDAVPVPARRQRREQRGRLRLAQRARAARLRRARRLRRVRAARRPGPARARAARARPAPGLHLGDGRGRRHRGDGQPHRLHRRGGRRARLPARGRARALGRDPRPRRRRRAASARATRCASRSATRCTATTSARSGTRSRAGSAGSARSTRTSPAPRRCARSRPRGPERKLVAFRMTEQAIPRQGMAIEGGGEVTSGSHLADARGRHRPRLRSRRR